MATKKSLFALAVFFISLISVVSAFTSENTVSSSDVYFVNQESSNSTVPVYRLWNSISNDHVYTIDESEKNNLLSNENDWNYEGIAFYVYAEQVSGTKPVYQMWSEVHNSHFYTIRESEKNYLLANYPASVWDEDGIAFYAFETPVKNTLPVYRFWQNLSGNHFYTIDPVERDYLIENYPLFWIQEETAFYVFNSSISDDDQDNETDDNETVELEISNLRVSSKTSSSITWKWSNPSEDFDGLAVYLDGDFVTNLSNVRTSYKASGLDDYETYTLSIRVIQNGSISDLVVSDSERTEKESSSSSSSDSNKYYALQNGDSGAVFTSSNDYVTGGVVSLNGGSVVSERSEGIFDNVSPLHYVLVAVVLLCIVLLGLIFKNI